jgi:hypothetical protein
MLTPTIATVVVAAFFIGFAFGFAACFYGVTTRREKIIEVPQLFGTYEARDKDGVGQLYTRADNPSTAWSMLLKGNPGQTRKQLQAKGYKVSKVS